MSTGFEHLACAGLTDVGRRRKNNEDSLVSLLGQGVFCVADGMGGVQGGEIASQATVDALRAAFTDSPDAAFALTAKASGGLIGRALNNASQWIKARADERGLSGSGSTAVVLAFDRLDPSRALVLHAGDSRVYRYRADTLLQLSADHSVAAAAGLTDERDLPAMFRGVITRAVGLQPTVELEETETDIQPNDLFILCSDGLTKMVPDKLLQKILAKDLDKPLDGLAKVLIDEALKAGGEDNVTVLLVRVAETLPQASTQEIPPETRALEAWTPPVTPPPPAANAHELADAPTSETGQTPPTPPSGFGNTPNTPASASRHKSSAPGPSRTPLLILIFLVLLVIAAAVGTLFLRQRATENTGGAVPPAEGQPAAAAAPESRSLTPEH